MASANLRRVAIDSSVINWMAGQGLASSVQENPAKRRENEAIEQLFALQDKGRVTLVAVDQVDRETEGTATESKRAKIVAVRKKCRETYFLTRFASSTKSKRASRSPRESGINLADGAYWITEDDVKKIDDYISHGKTDKERVDLEVLATVAIADVHTFVTVDYHLLNNTKTKDFVKREDNIDVCQPSHVVKQLLATL